MRVQSALLCDAASVREGLLHVLGGGLTSGVRPLFPAPLGVTLAVVYEVESQDLSRRVDVRVVVARVGAEDRPILELDGDLGVEAPSHAEEGVPILLPVVIDLGDLPVPQEGVYSVQMFCDGTIGADLTISMRAERLSTAEG